MLSVSRIILAAFTAGLALGVRAQDAGIGAPTSDADQQWSRVATAAIAAEYAQPAIASPQTAVVRKGGFSPASLVVSGCLSCADDLGKFAANFPDDRRCHEARRREALLLLLAAFYGDTTQAAPCSQLVAQVRHDPSLPVADRYAVAALADNGAVSLGNGQSHDDLIKQYETIARNHIAEFGDLPETYAALLRVAQNAGDSDATRISNNLLAMHSPPNIQAGAQNLLARHALVGTSLNALLGGVIDISQLGPMPKGQMVIIYAWATSVPDGVLQARMVSDYGPSDCTIIGVNMDPDVASASARAGELQLRGFQVFGDPARDFSNRWMLTTLPLVLTVDQKGVISAVFAAFPFAADAIRPAK